MSRYGGLRRRSPSPTLDGAEARVDHRPLPGLQAAQAMIGGLGPQQLPSETLTSSLAQLSSQAGNGAVATLVSHARADMPLDPPGGVREIRRLGGGGQLGLTRTAMPTDVPLFRLPAPQAAEGGAAVKPSRTRARELDFEVRYPTAGRHLLYEATNDEGQPANTYLEIDPNWAGTILGGENDHVNDHTISRRMTWGKVEEVVNAMADGEPITAPTPDEARLAAWRQFVGALPAPLRPEGNEPTEAAQEAKWGASEPSTVFRQLIAVSKRERDNSGSHTPDANLDHMEGAHEIRVVSAGTSSIGTPTPESLMETAWNALAAGGGGGGGSGGARSGGGRRR